MKWAPGTDRLALSGACHLETQEVALYKKIEAMLALPAIFLADLAANEAVLR
jgi:hypothetical protein